MERAARVWFGLTALCVVVGVGMQVVINARTPEYFGGSPLGRAANVFAFFTIESNVIVGVTSALLAVRFTAPNRGPSARGVAVWLPVLA